MHIRLRTVLAVAKIRGRKPKSKVDYEAVRIGTSREFQHMDTSLDGSADLELGKRRRTAPGRHARECKASSVVLIECAGRSQKDSESIPLSPVERGQQLLPESDIVNVPVCSPKKLSAIDALILISHGDGSDSSDSDDSCDDSSHESHDSSDDSGDIDGPNTEWGATSKGEIARRRREQQPPPSVIDTAAHNNEMLALADESFDEQFIWSEQKVIAVRSYFAALKCELSVMEASKIAAIASHTDERSVRSYVADFENNNGWFSPSVWGTNTKTPSLMADVEHRLWARQWVIANMGHRNNAPNKRAIDFQRAAHEHFEYDFDPVSPVISLRCATAWLHTVVGAEFAQVKKGTFVDGHGKDHVVEQRT